MRIFILLPLVFCLSGCGYRFGRGEALQSYSTVCVPYVEGDVQGQLTDALIRAITTKGALAYRSYGADLLLNVCLFEPLDENIGYTYAPGEDFLVSDQARLTVTARVQLLDRCTGQCVLEPFTVSSDLTYDFESDLSNVDEQQFSLGQLQMHTMALDAALPAAYTLLAEKIVDYLKNSW